MAKIVEEVVTIRFSSIVREDSKGRDKMVTPDTIALIDATVQEVLELDPGVVVEVESPWSSK